MACRNCPTWTHVVDGLGVESARPHAGMDVEQSVGHEACSSGKQASLQARESAERTPVLLHERPALNNELAIREADDTYRAGRPERASVKEISSSAWDTNADHAPQE